MKQTLFCALCLVPLSMGCGSVDDTSGNPTASGGKNKGGIDQTLETGLVVAKTPVGLNGTLFVGDFWFGTDLICSGVSVCELTVTGDTTVSFKCPEHLFVPKTAYGDPTKTTEVTWTADSDWGLAPKGTYHTEPSNFDGQVKTWVEGDKILLDFDGTTIGAVNGDKFAWKEPGGSLYIGSITDDLKTITYHRVTASGKEVDVTLTFVE
jgi:hypothetical protein